MLTNLMFVAAAVLLWLPSCCAYNDSSIVLDSLAKPCAAGDTEACSLNGECNKVGTCDCDAGWMGANCSFVDLAPADKASFGYRNASQPTMGGDVVFHDGKWHMFVCSPALQLGNGTDTFPCDSQILRMEGDSVTGPFTLVQQVRNRSHFSPKLHYHAEDSRWTMFMTGVNAPEPTSRECQPQPLEMHNRNCTARIVRSAPGSITEWEDSSEQPLIQAPTPGYNRDEWNCFCQDPSPFILDNGTFMIAARCQYCYPYRNFSGAENVALAVADGGIYSTPYRLLTTTQPVFPLGSRNEDPFVWQNSRGWHMLMHNQDPSAADAAHRGGYAWSHDALTWNFMNDDVWPWYVDYTDGTREYVYRRQIPKIITDPASGQRYLLNGVDSNPGPGTHYGSCWTLMQPFNE